MTLGQYFHVGIIVPDVAEARAHLTELVGCQWGPIVENDVDVRDADGREIVAPNQICYSTDGPHIELIADTPGTPWTCNPYSNLHHIGYFSGTIGAESVRLGAAGCPLEFAGGHGSGPPTGWAYHRDPLGVRIELCDESIRAVMEGYLFRPA